MRVKAEEDRIGDDDSLPTGDVSVCNVILLSIYCTIQPEM